MPRSKKLRLIDASLVIRRSRRVAGRLSATFDDLGVDELAIIFSFLPREEIMCARLNKTMRAAAKEVILSKTDFVVNNIRRYNLMVAMSTALPNIQQITLRRLCQGHRYSDGEDPDELGVVISHVATHDINFISTFRQLRVLEIDQDISLNGRYPLFNFPLLQKLSINHQRNLKFDLDMMAGLPIADTQRVETYLEFAFDWKHS